MKVDDYGVYFALGAIFQLPLTSSEIVRLS
jgi:hypothetical protein